MAALDHLVMGLKVDVLRGHKNKEALWEKKEGCRIGQVEGARDRQLHVFTSMKCINVKKFICLRVFVDLVTPGSQKVHELHLHSHYCYSSWTINLCF